MTNLHPTLPTPSVAKSVAETPITLEDEKSTLDLQITFTTENIKARREIRSSPPPKAPPNRKKPPPTTKSGKTSTPTKRTQHRRRLPRKTARSRPRVRH